MSGLLHEVAQCRWSAVLGRGKGMGRERWGRAGLEWCEKLHWAWLWPGRAAVEWKLGAIKHWDRLL